jgi:hypothetical protein
VTEGSTIRVKRGASRRPPVGEAANCSQADSVSVTPGLRCRAMPGHSELVPFVTVSDADRAAEFYEGVVGLRLHEHTCFALVFRCANATFRVAVAEHVAPAPTLCSHGPLPTFRALLPRLSTAACHSSATTG